MIVYLYWSIALSLISYLTYKECKKQNFFVIEDVVAPCIIGLFTSSIGFVILALVMDFVVVCTSPRVVKQQVVRPIVSLTTKDIHRPFVLGCSGNYPHYYFMYDLGDSKYQRGSTAAEDTLLRETDTEAPNYSYNIVHPYTPKWNFWWPERLTFRLTGTTDHVLTVPKGTVVQQFEVR